MEMRMAEVNLQAAKRERALLEQAAKLETERVVNHAETELSKAKIKSEASQGLLDLFDDETPLSAYEKVSGYLNGLSQP